MGMPFIIMQAVLPGIIIAIMQSQQAWIILAQVGSPLVQVIITPMSVICILHMPIMRLQLHIIMPFIMTQQPHMPLAIILQRFCSMAAAVASSQVQVIFIPPVHFSIFIMHWGTIIPPDMGMAIWPPDIGMLLPMLIIPRSIIIVLIGNSLWIN
jgi:hypothetical protein